MRQRRVAAFDFDGTLTRHDTLIPFLTRVAGRRAMLRAVSRMGGQAARRAVPLSDRDRMKELMIADLLAGRSEAELRNLGTTFGEEILSGRMNQAVLRRLEEHLSADHEVILVSASLVYYLDPIAERLGLHAVIAVEPTVVDGVLDGTLSRPNVRAEQKAIRLGEWLERTNQRSASSDPSLSGPTTGSAGGITTSPDAAVELWAYGNSSGDHALLEAADHAFWLGRPTKTPAGSTPFESTPLVP